MGKKVKVVLDTNVWVSVLLNKGLAKDLLPLIEKRKISIYLSYELLKELARVLTYPKISSILEKARADLAIALSSIVRSARLARPKKAIDEIKEDPADNRVLECGMAAKAQFIISGDKHLLTLSEFRGIRILKAKEFLEALEAYA